MTDVNQIVHDFLAKARKIIADGEHWSPFVLIVHSTGTEALSIPDVGRTAEEKQRVTDLIAGRMKQRNAALAIMVTDVWLAKVPAGATPPKSARNDPGRTEALAVTIWGPGLPTRMGIQTYARDADGKPVFAEFSWQEPHEHSASRFAGDDGAWSDGGR
jgi:hypothetical protein